MQGNFWDNLGGVLDKKTDVSESSGKFWQGAEDVVNFGVDAVDFTTSLPKKIDKIGDDLNEKLIDFGKLFKRGKNEAAAVAESNLTENKVRQTGENVFGWLQKPKNALITAAAVVGIIIAIRKG